MHTLAHSSQTDAGFCARSPKVIQTPRRYAVSIISYFQNYLFTLLPKTDPNLRRSRVPMYIRQALLEDAEKNNLYLDGESLFSGCNIQFHLDPGSLGKALDVPLRSASKADFIQQWRVQEVGRGADFLNGLIRQGGGLGGKNVSRRVLPAVFLKKRNADFQCRQRLAGAVVQVARQLAPLLLLNFEKPLRKALEFGSAL
jgi:hypothetical protein